MPQAEHVPTIIAGVTLVAGTALAVAPKAFAGPLGLEGQDVGLRAVGIADLVLVPGLYGGRPRWPWMVGRAALSVAQAAYCHGVAPGSKQPGRCRAAAVTLLGLSIMDASTAMQLRGSGV